MMIELSPGESVTVTLKDTDGEFVIEYGERVLSVTSELPDSDGREGVIYSERFADEFDKLQALLPKEE